jgi:hypothetical protein
MIVNPADLNSLGLLHGTDKSSDHHDYLKFYERYFAPLRNDAVTILEIGVLSGASLAMWESYFAHGHIIGADIDGSTLRFKRPRVDIEIMDQGNLDDLVRLGLKHGPFDIIIDDGSHLWNHQIIGLQTLFPFLKDGGIYIVEDLQTNFGEMADTYRGVSRISCVEYLKKLVDLRVADELIDIRLEEDAFLRTYGRRMRSINFYKHCCLLEKDEALRQQGLGGKPLVEMGADPTVVPVAVMAHIGQEGDIWNTISIRSLKEDYHIQGFAIEILDQSKIGLAYRGRLPSGDWSEWASNGEFVGTRGAASDLTGFTVRFADGSAQNFSLEITGEFVGAKELVTVRQGEDCTAGDALKLRGMQIIVRAKGGV